MKALLKKLMKNKDVVGISFFVVIAVIATIIIVNVVNSYNNTEVENKASAKGARIETLVTEESSEEESKQETSKEESKQETSKEEPKQETSKEEPKQETSKEESKETSEYPLVTVTVTDDESSASVPADATVYGQSAYNTVTDEVETKAADDEKAAKKAAEKADEKAAKKTEEKAAKVENSKPSTSKPEESSDITSIPTAEEAEEIEVNTELKETSLDESLFN